MLTVTSVCYRRGKSSQLCMYGARTGWTWSSTDQCQQQRYITL